MEMHVKQIEDSGVLENEKYVPPILNVGVMEMESIFLSISIEPNVTVDESTNVIFDGDEEYIDITF